MLLEDLPVDLALAFSKVNLVQNVCVLEHSFLERYQNELRLWEPLAYHVPDVLSVRQIEGRVDFIQDVERRRLVQKKRQNEGKS